MFERCPDLEGVVDDAKAGIAYRGSDGAMTCFLCDCEMEWEDCSECGGEGGFDGYEEDPNWYQPGEIAPCSQCGGRGGYYWCQTKDCKTITCTRVVASGKGGAS